MSLQQDIDNLVDAICNTYYSGGPMHIVLDDCNIDTNSIQNNSVVNNTNTSVQTNTQQQNSLENSLTNLQDKWADIIKSLNERMKDLKSIDGLMNEVYLKRQEAIDLFYGTAKILSKQTRDYKTKASSIYLALKSGSSGIRYTNESAINLQIESQLSAEKESVDLLDKIFRFIILESLLLVTPSISSK